MGTGLVGDPVGRYWSGYIDIGVGTGLVGDTVNRYRSWYRVSW